MKPYTDIKLLANDNRQRIVTMVNAAKNGHVGGALSIIDILTTIYDKYVDFNQESRSKVVLSKGHAVPSLYSTLVQKGMLKEEELLTFRSINSRLQGHPQSRYIDGVDATTGLLGQGLSVAVGMAIVKRNEQENNRVFAILGDAEIHEGQIWEGLLSASHFKLDNLVIIVDYNKLSSGHPTNDVMNLEPIIDKFNAFNLHVIEIDGHDMEAIDKALDPSSIVPGQPTMIVAHTIKGKGVSFMENNPKWHSSGLTPEEYSQAMSELKEARKEIVNELQ